ncbi:MAG TPA: phosphate signaling complex protein PhoU [Gemmatimonadota bacterium]|nr:phosphate signaling complex protein PhoU [Gemmatimonadota bacterium]
MSPEDSVKATQRHFDQELKDLRELLLRMAGRAEEQMRSGLTAVKRLDAQAAQQTILADRDVDALELEIEEQAINLLARRQPMAGDLRTLVAVLKISNDLERVGDHAVNIAQCAKRLAEAFPMPQPTELDQMAELATGMLRDAITAFIERDVALARNVCMRDEEVDRYNDTVFRLMLSRMAENTNTVIPALQMMLVARNLERVADLATNLGEDVIYIVEARTIKHHATEIEGEFDQ